VIVYGWHTILETAEAAFGKHLQEKRRQYGEAR
jgi:hypothetical protein